MAPKKKAAPPASSSGEPQLSRFQAFRNQRMHRRQLKGAPYNPRVISDEARKKLKKNLDVDHNGVGLLGPVTWNEVTGNVVGGHQRLAILDALEGHDNYTLDVAVVQLTVKQEIEQNIALNSDRLAGDWDLDLLAKMLKTPDLDLSATGFTVTDIQVTFDDPELGSIFATNVATKGVLAEVQAMQDDGKAEKDPAAAATREIMKETRANNKENFKDDDTETFSIVMFPSREERDAFVVHCGGAPTERYIDGSMVLAKMGTLLAKPRPPPPVEAAGAATHATDTEAKPKTSKAKAGKPVAVEP